MTRRLPPLLRMPILLLVLLLALGLLALLALPGVAQDRAARGGRSVAEVTLRDVDGNAVAQVRFVERGILRRGGNTVVRAAVRLPDEEEGFHGFHVHANDNPSNGEGCIADDPAGAFTSADGHYAEEGQEHGDHLGDLPSLLVNSDGTALLRVTTDRFEVSDLIGRAVIIHTGPDNFGNIPLGEAPTDYTPNSDEALELTADTGNAGSRLACGVIEAS